MPTNAKPDEAPEMAPDKVRLPVPPRVVAVAMETAPEDVAAVPLELTSAPVLPPPWRVSALASVLPLRSKVPPLTVMVPVPKGPLVTLPVVLAPALRVPALTVVPPLKVLAPDSVQMPVPCFVKVVEPEALAMTPLEVPPAEPPKVSALPAPAMFPVKAIVPPSATMELLLLSVMGDCHVAAAPLFINAPPLLIPVPLRNKVTLGDIE